MNQDITFPEPQGLSKGYSERGSSMGRVDDVIDPDFSGTMVCEPILDPCPNTCGAYDYEGAYWGAGTMVWRVVGEEGGDSWTHYIRARDIETELRGMMPNIKAIKILERPIGEHCGADWGETPCDHCLEYESEE